MKEREKEQSKIIDPQSESQRLAQKDEIDLMDFLVILGRQKKLFFGVPVFFFLVSIVISLILTPIYTAKTLIMPPQQSQSAAGALLEQLGPLAGAAGAAAGLKNPSDLYIAILKSHSVYDQLIQKFNLMERFGTKTLMDTRAALEAQVKINSEKLSGLILVQASDPDPRFAADLANAHVDVLQTLLGKLAFTEAQKRRVFFQKQVNELAEKPFRNMQIQEGILSAMMRQYEIARVDEAKEGPLVQQISVATPPDKRSSPKRALIVMVSTFLGFLIGAVLALVRDHLKSSLENQESASKWKELIQAWSLTTQSSANR